MVARRRKTPALHASRGCWGGMRRKAQLPIWRDVAKQISRAQEQAIDNALNEVVAATGGRRAMRVVGVGAGAFLIEALAARRRDSYVRFCDLVPARDVAAPDIMTCAPAAALALLADQAD